jgi:hypothetical protein
MSVVAELHDLNQGEKPKVPIKCSLSILKTLPASNSPYPLTTIHLPPPIYTVRRGFIAIPVSMRYSWHFHAKSVEYARAVARGLVSLPPVKRAVNLGCLS